MCKSAFAVLLGSLFVVAPSWAAEGEVCRSEGHAMQMSMSMEALSNETVFKCERAGEKTIPELYEAGWRVVQYMPLMGVQQPEDQRMSPRQMMNHVILIEKI